MFEIMEAQTQDAVIKVIGVGGCGGNAVDHMIEQGVQGVEFIAINTDAQALGRSKARTQLQIGVAITKGLGAGAKPSVGQAAAEEDRERIKELIAGANMVFITAGMGGGTGTGAAPIVAQIAREMNILTVAVVTKPFIYEGNRMRYATEGIKALNEHVDSLIIVPNAKLMEVLGNDVTVPEAFKAANGVLQGAVAGIAEVINVPGLINVDFADVRTVMSENGMAMMGSAVASGPDRAREAAERAIASPLLEDVDMTGARGVLVNITSTSSLKVREMEEVMACVQFAAEEATVILGSVFDESMGDELRVTVVATGLGSPVSHKMAKPEIVYQNQDFQRTGTHDMPYSNLDYVALDTPTIMRSGRRAAVDAMEKSGVDTYDIPSFLRKQAD
ncbi:MAG: cell division protein FtsZ [Gallionellales bacterium CG_4_10_14_3_um_filter_54_96]|nr:MAG: cell division protein FtsZ [Gallionellaceae bacterium CG1_02_56_997]PIV14296.1 MAG: cell division protein FtsZ [Gallionellales bacterium CG03_land_8_20_14_0_80_55_15]PIV91783.1 MAG: cell division protein FtsZ [Gallionellales bacterium CG17_big_fil_post_rev_8_21_14_2_50_54_146]PIX04790.1 MAG: cell division protein FtsZ [Gallionellales bacterium CG_4_8_14_3_um_filter_54_18]PIY03709.1 MAG: cell division protein FtsZ [Gallionellales bacterium CG_4_10_14_3_um_filter_54_96]PJC03222.1 MAG: ce